MIKLLIADDEKWICSLIESAIDFNGLNMELVGMAYDGEEAFKKILTFRPEIVITDIKMPRMDGLELIKAVRDEGLNTKFIIISGHSTFEYARTAVRYQVEEYLLKPISARQLGETLEKICSTIRAKQAEVNEFSQLLDNFEETVEKLRVHLVSDVIYSPRRLVGKQIEDINAEYKFRFVPGYFQVLLFHALPAADDFSLSPLLKKLDQTLKLRLSVKCCEYEALIDQHRIVIIINYNETLKSIMPEIINYTVKSILQTDQMATMLTGTLYIGKAVDCPEKLTESFVSAERITNLGLLRGMNACYDVEKIPGTEDKEPASITELTEDQLIRVLTEGVYEDLYPFCRRVFDDWNDVLLRTPSKLDSLLTSIFDAIETGCARRGLGTGSLESLRDDFFFNLRTCKSKNQMFQLLTESLKGVQKYLQEVISSNKNIPMTKIKDYINSHYAEKLTVELLAEKIYLTPNYFCALFKKETGVTFRDYLTNVRIEKAKLLLQDPQYTVSYIGKEVGYPNSRYFSKNFKKVVGVTPNEYRSVCTLSQGLDGEDQGKEGLLE